MITRKLNTLGAIAGIYLCPIQEIFCSAGTEVQENTVPTWQKELPVSISGLQEIQAQVQSNFLKVKNSVVSVEAEDGAGSGILISPDGLILTAAHVIGESGKKMKIIFPDGEQAEAISLGGSELSDAGLLKIVGSKVWEHTKMAPPNKSNVGDWCFALGHPSGFDKERGMVLRVGRIIEKSGETLQTDCRLLGGDSGGPLFSMNGEVIGIHSRISGNPEDNFHTPIESFHSNWDYFINEDVHTLGALHTGGFLGVLCEQTPDGLVVVELVENAPAQLAGIQVGDILKHLDGSVLDTREKLTILISSKRPGSSVVIDFIRDSYAVAVRINLGERPSW